MRKLAIALWLGLVTFGTVEAQVAAVPRQASLRNANYTIEAELFPKQKMISGRMILSWRNIQAEPTDQLWFHLYWNAWRNDRSTWMLEDKIRGRSDLESEVRPGDWGWQEVDAARLLANGFGGEQHAEADLTESMFWASPDDGNHDDRTVFVIQLPRQVQPGETIRVEMSWRSKIPRTFARTGFRGESYLMAHWFPKLGVYEPSGWNCHQFHAATEFYSDYGNYDVKLTLPSRYVVGATGQEGETTENSNGTTTHRFEQRDVHGFAWATSPDYQVREALFSEPGLPPVKMRLLIQPEHIDQAERHFNATRAAFKYYGTWYGPYPYEQVTIIDPPYRSGHAGMEYPTLFTCGTRLFNWFGADSPESVTVHEAGHQFWYGLIGNNEFEEAWLDEGFNTFSTTRTLNTAYPDRVLSRRFIKPPGWSRSRGFLPVHYPEIKIDRSTRRVSGVRSNPHDDVPGDPTYLYYPATAGTISYSQTALWLETLEGYLGWEVLQEIMSTFFERYQFLHPTGQDFIDVANEISPQNLDWFFDQVTWGSVEFDYAIRRVESFPSAPEGMVDRDGQLRLTERKKAESDAGGDDEASAKATPSEPAEEVADSVPGPVEGVTVAEDSAASDVPSPAAATDDDAVIYTSRVVVQRKGDGVFPVDVLVMFVDGTEKWERWDGQARWKAYIYHSTSKVDFAVVDPERVLALDTHPTNNSRVRKSKPKVAATKWSARWMIWMQDFLTTAAFFG